MLLICAAVSRITDYHSQVGGRFYERDLELLKDPEDIAAVKAEEPRAKQQAVYSSCAVMGCARCNLRTNRQELKAHIRERYAHLP